MKPYTKRQQNAIREHVDRLSWRPPMTGDPQPLTEREHQICKMLAEGIDDELIAQHFGTEVWMLATEIFVILGKCKLTDRVELALKFRPQCNPGY